MFLQKLFGSTAIITCASAALAIAAICVPQTRTLASDAIGLQSTPSSPTAFVVALAGSERAPSAFSENIAAVTNTVVNGVQALGGVDGIAVKAKALDTATAAGVPLADADISEADRADLAAQGATVVVDCASTSPTISMLSDMLADAGGDAIPCGAMNKNVAAYNPSSKS